MITVRAAAKVNLHLGVGAPREDGFHPLETVYQAVGLCDDVVAYAADGWDLQVRGSDWVDLDAVPLDRRNLVARAGELLAAHHGLRRSGHVEVVKSIPVAGGLAGGSADAAAALVALDRLWDVETTDEDLLALAAELGSDVPFALLGGTALGTGRGELVEPVADHGSWWWVLVPSREGLSTPAVYRRFDELHPDAPAAPPSAQALLTAVATGEPLALARALHNDLQEPALDLRPDLAALLARGEAEGALRGIVSGSGPTCAFLCSAADEARAVAGALQGADSDGGDGAADPVTVLVATAPVAGAHVVV